MLVAKGRVVGISKPEPIERGKVLNQKHENYRRFIRILLICIQMTVREVKSSSEVFVSICKTRHGNCIEDTLSPDVYLLIREVGTTERHECLIEIPILPILSRYNPLNKSIIPWSLWILTLLENFIHSPCKWAQCMKLRDIVGNPCLLQVWVERRFHGVHVEKKAHFGTVRISQRLNSHRLITSFTSNTFNEEVKDLFSINQALLHKISRCFVEFFYDLAAMMLI